MAHGVTYRVRVSCTVPGPGYTVLVTGRRRTEDRYTPRPSPHGKQLTRLEGEMVQC